MLAASSFRDRRVKATLQYAFSVCSSGQTTDLYGACMTIPSHLRKILQSVTGQEAGGNSGLPQCKLFDPEVGAATCNSANSTDSCTWNWEGYRCENDPPGDLQ